MHQRTSTIRSLIAILILVAVVAPAATVTAAVSLPSTMVLELARMLPDQANLSPSVANQPAPSLGTFAAFAPIPLAASCTSQCRDLYFSCLDDCDAAPFPGCYNHCRFDVLYPCYGTCLGGK